MTDTLKPHDLAEEFVESLSRGVFDPTLAQAAIQRMPDATVQRIMVDTLATLCSRKPGDPDADAALTRIWQHVERERKMLQSGPAALVEAKTRLRNDARDLLSAHLPADEVQRIDAEIQRAIEGKLAGGGTEPAVWQSCSLADAYDYINRDPPRQLVGGLIVEQTMGMPYGPPDSLKTMLFMDAAICVASGEPWLDPLPGQAGRGRQTSQCSVAWIDFDNGRGRIDERLGALARARNLPIDTPIHHVSMPRPWLDMGNPDSVRYLRSFIMGHEAELCFIDNLGLIRGQAEENSADMTGVMSGIRQLVEDCECAIFPIHHQRKSNGTIGRAGDTLRGHSSIEASLDLALLIEREPQSPLVTIKSTKSRDREIHPFAALWTYEVDEHDRLITARFWGQTIEDNQSPGAIRDAILDVLGHADREPNQTQIVKAVQSEMENIGRNKVLGELALLESTRAVRSVAGPRNSKRYFLG